MAKKKTKVAGRVKPPAIPIDQRYLKFSLEYLRLGNPKFALGSCCAEFFAGLFREIVRYQRFTVDAFKEPSKADHRHYIYFPQTTEPDGFDGIDPNQDEEIWTDSAWQFGIPGQVDESTWRAHGFINGEYFYIVWLDPLHDLD